MSGGSQLFPQTQHFVIFGQPDEIKSGKVISGQPGTLTGQPGFMIGQTTVTSGSGGQQMVISGQQQGDLCSQATSVMPEQTVISGQTVVPGQTVISRQTVVPGQTVISSQQAAVTSGHLTVPVSGQQAFITGQSLSDVNLRKVV